MLLSNPKCFAISSYLFMFVLNLFLSAEVDKLLISSVQLSSEVKPEYFLSIFRRRNHLD